MSAAAAHGAYTGPSSLPSDYALLARYASARRNANVNDERDDISTFSSNESDSDESPSVLAVNEVAHSYRRTSIADLPIARVPPPRDPSVSRPTSDSGVALLQSAQTESTPLINPRVPRIVETYGIDEDAVVVEDGGDHDPERGSGNENDGGFVSFTHEPEDRVVMFRNELGILTKYALPVFGTHVLEYTLLLASVLSLGHLGTIELAACTLGTMSANVTAFSIIQGLTSALDTLLPAAWTGPHPEMVAVWCQRMTVVLIACLIPMYFIWFNATPILLFLKQDPDVASLAGVYLRWLSIGLPAYAFNCVSRRYFQCQGLFTVPTRIILLAAPVNAFLNWVLVWAPPPLPSFLRLGFAGAPLATAISYNLVSVGSVVYGVWVEREKRRAREEVEAGEGHDVDADTDANEVENRTARCSNGTLPTSPLCGGESGGVRKRRKSHNHRRHHHHHRPDPSYVLSLRSAWHALTPRALHPTGLATLVSLGLGGVGQTASEWWAWELVGLAASLLGPTALASQSVLLVSCSTTFQAPFALAIATSVRIGNLLGERRPRRAEVAAQASIVIGLVVAGVFSAMFFVFRNNWSYIFNDDPSVATLVSAILPLIALFQVFDGNAAITGGILRARGKQITGALLNLSAYYIVGVPLGVYLAFRKRGLPETFPEHPLAAASPEYEYPSLEEATEGLRGLWLGLTVSLVYCSVFGSVLCLRTDWEREVGKVVERMSGEERERKGCV